MAQESFLDEPTPDVMDQWRFYFSILAPTADGTIVDVGCGTGEAERFLIQEYPRIRKIVGVEKDQRWYRQALDRWRQDGSPGQIELKLGDALDLPFPDGAFDYALCVDMLEWVSSTLDIEPMIALQEIRRVLKPDGSAVIIHTDFDTQIFNTTDRELCRRIVHSFADAGPNGQMGRSLFGLCQQAGFRTVEPLVYTLVNTAWQPNLYGYKIAHMMGEWLVKKSLVSPEEIARWIADLEGQTGQGNFFYSINRYICRCTR
ncbi:MAG: methyltransferase domain-containing protein [Chloroflexi bacterium]|nr:methyltransferase domain-containing protein [Chloroflexota bacterium]